MTKPENKSGMRCPQFRDKCSKVCHTCELWIPLAVTDKATGVTSETWRCTQVWHAMMMVQVGQDVHQGAAATESLRNVIASGLARTRPAVTGHADYQKQVTIQPGD
jgi:hypothetical protein